MQHDACLTNGGWRRVKRYLGNAKIQGPLFKKGASLIGMLCINFKVWRWMKKTFDTCRQSRPPKRSIFGSSLSISRPRACFLGWLFSAQRILSRCENFPFLFVLRAIPSPQHQKLKLCGYQSLNFWVGWMIRYLFWRMLWKPTMTFREKNIGNNKRCFRTKCFLCTIILPGFRLSEEDPSLLAHPLQEDVRAAPRYGNTALWDSQVDWDSQAVLPPITNMLSG